MQKHRTVAAFRVSSLPVERKCAERLNAYKVCVQEWN